MRDAGRTGRLVFLFSDIVDSTALWDRHGDPMSESLRLHDAITRQAVDRYDGEVFSNPGDGFGAAFGSDEHALDAAIEIQAALAQADWGSGPALSVRVGLHAGEAEAREGNFFGGAVNQAARVCDAAHGGQIVVTATLDAGPRHQLRALGDHLLKGVSEPVAMFQVGDEEFGHLRALDVRRSNLAASPNELVGRDDDIATVSGLLDEWRMVTVTGVGGVGKSRLTHAVGGELTSRFMDGVWVAELAPCRDLRSVLSTTAAALGVPVPRDTTRLAELVHGHDLVLILDNCEHVADAVAELCDSLLTGSSRLRILTSSREQIGVHGERLYPLAPFASTDDAVRVFTERAAALGSDLGPADSEPIRGICEQLDRIPLAIELAAATCRVMSPPQILDRLDRRFELLRGAGRWRARDEHETLRSAIDWSYESLDATQQEFLRRVAFFNGGFGLDGAEAIASDLDRPAVFLLSELVDRSLIAVSTKAPEARYDLLETVRIYARDRTGERDETDASIDRHVAWCRAHIDAGTARSTGSGEAGAISSLTAEAANYRAAVARLLRRGDAAAAADLVLALGDVAYASNPLAELAEPVVSNGGTEDHPRRRELLGIELIRRSTVQGTEGRSELAAELLETLDVTDPGSLQLPVLLITSALGQGADAGYLQRLREHAHGVDDRAERARLLTAALLGTFFAADLDKPREQVTDAIDAATSAGLKRLLVPIGASACIGGLATGDVEWAAATARPLLELLDELTVPSIMTSGLVVTYTEAAVRADASAEDQLGGIRRLGPVLQGDFNRLGLALARLVQQRGEHRLAAQAVGACSRKGRSAFSQDQIAAILTAARTAMGSDEVDRALDDGARGQRSEIYHSMWSILRPELEALE